MPDFFCGVRISDWRQACGISVSQNDDWHVTVSAHKLAMDIARAGSVGYRFANSRTTRMVLAR